LTGLISKQLSRAQQHDNHDQRSTFHNTRKQNHYYLEVGSTSFVNPRIRRQYYKHSKNMTKAKEEVKGGDGKGTKSSSSSSSSSGAENIQASIAAKISEQLQRGTPLYDTTLKAAQWQRDNYLMGPYYADRRQEAREKRPNSQFLPRINHFKSDPKALGNVQMADLGSWFIPSSTVKEALMPLVLEQTRTSLYPLAVRGLVGLIDSQQANMDALVKSSVIDLLEQERIRHLVMNSTKGYIADSRRHHYHHHQNNSNKNSTGGGGDTSAQRGESLKRNH